MFVHLDSNIVEATAKPILGWWEHAAHCLKVSEQKRRPGICRSGTLSTLGVNRRNFKERHLR
jgi:hypothetical protein